MKRSICRIISVLVLSLTMLGSVWAAESKEEMNLQKDAAAIDTAAGYAQGEKVVTQQLEKDFNVRGEQIQGLRDNKMGYGEIAIVFSLAQTMPGGITDENISRIMTMRQGPPTMGWGNVAKNLGTKLGPAVSRVKKVSGETNKEMKRESRGDKAHMDKRQERKEEMHKEMRKEMHKESMGKENMGGGQGMAPGKGK